MNSVTRVSSSVLALSAAGALPAAAQDAQNSFILDVKAGYGVTDNSLYDKVGEDEAKEKLGADDDTGFLGSVRVRRSFSQWTDVSVGVSGFSLSDDASVNPAPGVGLDIEDRFSGFALDADMGWNKDLSGTPVRLFAGLRLAQVNSDVDKVFTDGADEADIEFSSSFLGIGPRVGVQMGDRFNASNFGWSAGASGAMLFGSLDTDADIEITSGPTDASISLEETTTVYNMDLELGLDWYLNDQSKVSVGYQAQKFWNVQIDEDADDRLVHGAYLGYTTSF